MSNIFESVEPIEDWMKENFDGLWSDFKCHCMVFTQSDEDARYFAKSFRSAMRDYMDKQEEK